MENKVTESQKNVNVNLEKYKELPTFPKGLLYFFIVTSSFNTLIKLFQNLMLSNFKIGIPSFLCEILGIISMILIVRKQKQGLYLLLLFLFLHFPLNEYFGCTNWDPILISVIMRSIVLALVIFIPVKGRSVYSVLMKQHLFRIDNKPQDVESKFDIPSDSISQDTFPIKNETELNNTQIIQESVDVSTEKIVEPNTVVQKVDKIHKKSTSLIRKFYKHNKTSLIISSLVVIIVLCIAGYYSFIYKSQDEKYEIAYGLIYRYKSSLSECKKGVEILENLAKDGHIKSINEIGRIYFYGKRGRFQNKKKGVHYFRIAAKKNIFEAIITLGNYYYDIGEFDKSLRYLEKADSIKPGSTTAKLFCLYTENYIDETRNENVDDKKAKQLIDAEIKRNKGYGKFLLSRYYYHKDDYELGFYYLLESESLNEDVAYADLAWAYYYGNGVPTNYSKAYKYLMKYIEIYPNNGWSNNLLGEMYEYGYYVEKDLATALKYYKIAAENDYDDAKKNVVRITSQL